MSPEEIRQHAARILSEHAAEPSYSLVYEDDLLEAATDDEQLAVHAAMCAARIRVEWDH